MRRTFVLLCAAFFLLSVPRQAAADLTAFFGITPTPDSRTLRGFGVGFGLLVVGFEFEYADIVEDTLESLPGLQTASGNVLLQTPIEVSGISLYGTAGGGVYRERLAAQQETSVGTNLGGGAKIRVAGPLRLRLDYRLFRLQGEPRHRTYQRFYAGANLSF
ncbi:MAG: hypothetical protein H0T71_08585 [Acidobacteria bacterium]|nr:hypothetical protein [Acidobacteriota bacterium]